ncbi:hypothetical protein Bca4012_017470 [Brassica carinata]|uniref:RNase H type-1 domain-containing protein n=1 Tax=Brassica carinata TaxID=52824 RepID=A0A8X7WNG5_BRACI|nr:hypothetical protein Bca52824_004079 [Brassica carinata]
MGSVIIKELHFFWGSAITGKSSSALEAEEKSLIASIQHAWSLGITSILFEGDSQQLVNILTGKQTIVLIDRTFTYGARKSEFVHFVSQDELIMNLQIVWLGL